MKVRVRIDDGSYTDFLDVTLKVEDDSVAKKLTQVVTSVIANASQTSFNSPMGDVEGADEST